MCHCSDKSCPWSPMKTLPLIFALFISSAMACPHLEGSYHFCRVKNALEDMNLRIIQNISGNFSTYELQGFLEATLQADGSITRRENPDGPFNGSVNEQSSSCKNGELIWISRTKDARGILLISTDTRLSRRNSQLTIKEKGVLYGIPFKRNITCTRTEP